MTEPYYSNDLTTIYNGKAELVLKELPSNHVDVIVTDPPYGISFMGKKWDYDVPSVEIWKECLRVLKPGGHLLSFAGTRTYHRMVVNIEDAGFQIRDMIAWVYGSGFPKSLNIGKAIDKAVGAVREVIGQNQDILKKQAKDIKDGKRKILDSFDCGNPERNNGFKTVSADITTPATEVAKQWDGWGTALKPALEPIVLARKPISEKTIAENVLKWGTGGLNIDECRVKYRDDIDKALAKPQGRATSKIGGLAGGQQSNRKRNEFEVIQRGRFPANLIHDGSDEVIRLFPESKGQQGDLKGHNKNRKSPNGCFGEMGPARDHPKRNDQGSAARFFYCAKASRKERNMNMEGINKKPLLWSSGTKNPGSFQSPNTNRSAQNNHPTVKPLALVRYLIQLCTSEGNVILDPFLGSGTTAIAAKQINRGCIGIEKDEWYCEISVKRSVRQQELALS